MCVVVSVALFTTLVTESHDLLSNPKSPLYRSLSGTLVKEPFKASVSFGVQEGLASETRRLGFGV